MDESTFVRINGDVEIQFDSPETLQINVYENINEGTYIYLDFEEMLTFMRAWYALLPTHRQQEVRQHLQ